MSKNQATETKTLAAPQERLSISKKKVIVKQLNSIQNLGAMKTELRPELEQAPDRATMLQLIRKQTE